MMDVRLITTSRSAPAISTFPAKELRITASMPNRKSATAKEPMVRTKRIFLRNKLARISVKNFTVHLRWKRFAGDQLPPVRLFPGEALHRHAPRREDRGSPSKLFS